jgi:iron complex outermembrane recepter protein
LNYNWDERWNSYVSVAYTSREPRLKNLYDAAEASTPVVWGAVIPQFAVDENGRLDFTRPLVTPESLLDIEVGSGFNSRHARGTLNLYWMEFSNEIVKSGQVDRFGQPITGNADRTRHIGIEVEGVVIPYEGFEIAANATLSRNRFVRHTDYSTGEALNLNNNPIAGFPDFLAGGRITYRMEGFSASLRGRYAGKQYTDNFRDEENTVDPYFVSDAWISCRLNNIIGGIGIEAKVQVNNVFDALYAAYGEGSSFFVGAERNVFFNVSIHL